MAEHWDKLLAQKLREAGLNQEQVGLVIGVVAEHRQSADREGYKRGFKNGSDYELSKMNRKKGATK